NVKRRLMDMGITPGITIEITGKAPLGDPIEICIRGYKLTLRKEEAEAILI
ncbi:MAG: FeoA family protein, partial [Clostridium sp.]